MGWTYTYRPKGMSNEEFFQAGFSVPLLQVKAHGFNEVYAAAQAKDGTVFGVAIMTRWVKDYYNFGYKEMDENMGPNIRNCPDSILDLLSPTTHEYALEWREECRRRNKTNPKVGDILRFGHEVSFRDGFKSDTLRVTKVTKSRVYVNNYYYLSKDYARNAL